MYLAVSLMGTRAMTENEFQDGRLLRIFLDEQDRSGVLPTYTAIVEFLRGRGIAGASAFRGIEGFGAHREVHAAKLFSWLPNLPIMIEVIEDWSVLEPLLPELEEMLGEGLITIEPVRYKRLSKGEKNSGYREG